MFSIENFKIISNLGPLQRMSRMTKHVSKAGKVDPSLRSCPLPIIPLGLSREEGMIHFLVGSHVKKPESGLFSDWIGNNTDDLRFSNWPKCSHPLVVVDFSLHFCCVMSSEYTREFVIKFLPTQFS